MKKIFKFYNVVVFLLILMLLWQTYMFLTISNNFASGKNINNDGNGRFAFYQSNAFRADKYILDTQTGEIWTNYKDVDTDILYWDKMPLSVEVPFVETSLNDEDNTEFASNELKPGIRKRAFIGFSKNTTPLDYNEYVYRIYDGADTIALQINSETKKLKRKNTFDADALMVLNEFPSAYLGLDDYIKYKAEGKKIPKSVQDLIDENK